MNTALKDWIVAPGARRRAALSAFGFSGTNAHLVIEQAPAIARRHDEQAGYLIALSAPTWPQLRLMVERLLLHCQQMNDIDCGNLSFTLLLGRKHFAHRLACVVADHWELTAFLQAWLQGGQAPRLRTGVVDSHARFSMEGMKIIGGAETFDGSADAYLDHLTEAATAYVEGIELDFAPLFRGSSYSRLPLPTSPFLKGRYWVRSSAENDAVDHVPSSEGAVPLDFADAQSLFPQPAIGEHSHLP